MVSLVVNDYIILIHRSILSQILFIKNSCYFSSSAHIRSESIYRISTKWQVMIFFFLQLVNLISLYRHLLNKIDAMLMTNEENP